MSERSDGLPLDEAALDLIESQWSEEVGLDDRERSVLSQARAALTLSAQVAALTAECARVKDALENAYDLLDVFESDPGGVKLLGVSFDEADAVALELSAALAAPSASEAWLAERDARVRAEEREACAAHVEAAGEAMYQRGLGTYGVGNASLNFYLAAQAEWKAAAAAIRSQPDAGQPEGEA